MEKDKKYYITSDTHGDYRVIRDYVEQGYFDPKNDNVLIILGDFGANYYLNYRDEHFKEKLGRYNLTYFVIRGNHEQRPSICYQENPEKWHMEEIFDNYCYVENDYPYIKYALDFPAQYYFGSKRVLVFPGAYSVDKNYRLAKGWSWFPEEQMTEEERQQGLKMLDLCGNSCDYILAHTCPRAFEPFISDLFFSSLDQNKIDKTTENYLNKVIDNCKYQRLYFGHYHDDRNIIPYQATMLYRGVIELGEKL